MTYAKYNATVLKEVTIGTIPDHAIAAMLAPTVAQIAGPGVPCLGFTRFRKPANGIPLSLAREYTVRDALVTDAKPQNYIAIETSAAIVFPNFAPSDVCKIAIAAGIAFPPASFALKTSGILRIPSVKAKIRAYPLTPATATAMTIPHATVRRGSPVSSAICAEAS